MCDSGSDWSRIPEIVLLEIYKYLGDKDRVSTARVCKNWHRLFETPLLWRYRCVSFGGFNAVSIAKNSDRYLKRFGKYLRTLSIRFQGPTYSTVKTIAEATELFLKQLSYASDIKLKQFTLFHANFEHCWHFMISRNRVVSALCRFLRRCRNLELLNLIAARMSLVDGCRILESLGRGAAGKTLKVLYMEDMFQTSITPAIHGRYVNAMLRIKGLTYLYTNYNTMDGDILRSLSNTGKMRTLTLTVDTDVNNCLIPPEDWLHVKHGSPQTKVIFYIYASGFRHDLRLALPPEIPLKEIDIVAWPAIVDTRGEVDQRLSALIHYISNYFNNTLESFTLHLDRNPAVDEEILYFLCRCQRVRDLSLYCKLSVNTVEKICQLQHHGQIDLRSLNIGILGLDETEWKQLVQVRAELLRTVKKKSNSTIFITSELESDDEEDMEDGETTEESENEDFPDLNDDDETDEEEIEINGGGPNYLEVADDPEEDEAGENAGNQNVAQARADNEEAENQDGAADDNNRENVNEAEDNNVVQNLDNVNGEHLDVDGNVGDEHQNLNIEDDHDNVVIINPNHNYIFGDDLDLSDDDDEDNENDDADYNPDDEESDDENNRSNDEDELSEGNDDVS